MIMTVVVAVIAVACVGLLSRRYTLIEFQDYVTNDEATDLERFRVLLLEHYHQHAGWTDAQSLIESIGRNNDKQLVLIDAQRNIVATSPAALLQSRIEISPDHSLTFEREERRGREAIASRLALRNVPHIALAESTGANVGTLYMARLLPTSVAPKEQLFVRGIDRSLLLAASVSAGLALLVAVFLSRRIVRPVELLTRAVRRMEQGDTSQRVDISTKDEIGELGRAFNSMADSLARVEQLRRNMVNDVAHELRTPLTNLRCQIETLQDGFAVPSAEVINSLHEETMLLNHLVDDLQDLALAEAGQLSLTPQRVSISDEVAQVVNAMQLQFSKSNFSVKVDVAENCPDVWADSRRLGQVLRNLLHNAITHTPPGGLVTIGVTEINSRVQLKIEDTGQGIPADDLKYVFERFYRADSSRDRATGGAGLGLAIVKQLVALHGSEIQIESEIGRGTSVTFSLPVFKTGDESQ